MKRVAQGVKVFTRVLAIVVVFAVTGTAAASVHCVPDLTPGGCSDSFATIQLALNASAASGDTVKVGPGTYAENLTVSKSIVFLGAQAGVDARGRVVGAPSPATESIIAPPAGVGLLLLAGSTGSTIDGFSFSGGTRGIESQGGPINNLQILNNSFKTFTGNAAFLNDTGLDITVQQNSMDGSGQTGSGDIFHLDTDNFNGFQFLDNIVANSPATGFFVDGNHNINPSVNRSPLIARNSFLSNATGANLGTRAFKNGSIQDNTFQSNVFDGLQGGIQNTTITGNLFKNNGRSGLALTSFGNLGVDRGGQFDTITCNAFTGNVREGIFLSSGQAVNTISTNTINSNNIFGNTVGLTYAGTETINAESNFWNSATGPTHSSNPGGTGDSVATTPASATNVDFVPFSTSQVVCVPPAGQPLPDLTISKTANPPSVVEGNNVTFVVTVTNGGTGDATLVSVTDLLPAGLTFSSATPSQGSYASGTGIWTVGTLTAFGGSATLTIVATLNPGTGGTTIQNTATITASTPADSTPGNNTASASFLAVAPSADLSISKTPAPPPYGTGNSLTYNIVVMNAGPQAATNVVVTDVLPAGTTFSSATPSQGSCSGTTTVTCTLGTLANGGLATVTLTLTLPATPGPMSNTATVASSTSDPNPANNTSTSIITVIAVDAIPLFSPFVLLLLALGMAFAGSVAQRLE